MNVASHDTRHHHSKIQSGSIASKLEAIGWGLFFIWVGLTFLLGFGSGIGLMGISIITLGMQGVRKYFNLDIDSFWIAIGLLFGFGGIGIFFELNIQPIPIVLVLAGILLLVSIFKRGNKHKHH